MNLRYWNAIGWGVVALIMSFCLAWLRTQWMVEIVVLFSIMVCVVVTSLLLIVTEPKQAERPMMAERRNHKAARGQFKMYTFRREGWRR